MLHRSITVYIPEVSTVKMANTFFYEIAVFLLLAQACFCLSIPEADQAHSRKERQVNIQVIVGDGNVQGINNNGAQGGTISQQCISCICSGYSPCYITWAYWADAGRPTLDGDAPYSDSAYSNCFNDAKCAKRAVESYVQKFQRDCNGDGKIDCSDYALIHQYGGFGGCVGKYKSC